MALNNPHPCINICSINICGLSDRSKLVLDKYVDSKKYDAVAVQETGSCKIDKLSLSNMNIITDSNEAKNRGVALYVRNNHSIAKLEQIGIGFKNIDSAWGLAVVGGHRYIIGNVYAKLDYVHCIPEVIAMLENAQQLNSKLHAKGIILTGDLNARHQLWGDSTANDYGRRLTEQLDQTKYSIMTSETPTFLSTNGFSYIDLVIVSNNLVDKIINITTDNEVELFSGAPFRGHVPLIITIECSNNTREPPVEKICIKEMNWNAWSQDLETHIEANEEYIASTEDPYELLQFIDNEVKKVTEKHGKKKIVSSHSKPYWTKTLSELSAKLRSDRKNYTKRNTDSNKEKLERSKKEFDEAREKACNDFIVNKTKNLNSTQSQKFWKEFKNMISSKSNHSINPLDDGDGGLLTESAQIEKLLFSTFFEGKHLKEAKFDEEFYTEINEIYEEVMNDNTNSGGEETDELNSTITLKEITDSIKKYKCSGKSFDNHGFQPEMFKHLKPQTLKFLQKIFNICLNKKIWIWENAEVIFLKKEGKKSYSIPGSYRPISITSYIGKLLEKIVTRRIIKSLLKNKHDDPNQEGFTEGKNTIRYMNRLYLDIKSDLLLKKTVICLFIDFEKAFDSVWKRALLVKLSRVGIKGNLLKLIDHFLSSRKVKLKVNGTNGPLRDCFEFGLPQGSALSPILFKIFMMDLLEELDDEDIVTYKFADDGTIKVAANSTAECLLKLQNILEAVDRWAKKWRMGINCLPNKTEVIVFGTAENNRALIPQEFILGDKKIKLVRSTKVLGIIIDEDLTFKEQSKDVYNKLTTRWNMIRMYCNRNWGFTQRIVIQLVKTLFLSCMLYGSHIWMSSKNMSEINSLYYQILKTSVGAIFNVKQSICEIIVGVPPVHIQNKMNQIKHYLKLNINDVPSDTLKKTVKDYMSNPARRPVELNNAIKQVYKYLLWKTNIKPEQFSEEDKKIVHSLEYMNFDQLTGSSCKYTKNEITKYTEVIWAESIRNEFLCEGHSIIPQPSCTPLPLSAGVSRGTEVMVMQMFYENNLLNSFLHRINIPDVQTSLCHCGRDEQTAYHVIFECETIDPELRARANASVRLSSGDPDTRSSIVLLNSSRDKDFIQCMVEIVDAQKDFIRNSIDLN